MPEETKLDIANEVLDVLQVPQTQRDGLSEDQLASLAYGKTAIMGEYYDSYHEDQCASISGEDQTADAHTVMEWKNGDRLVAKAEVHNGESSYEYGHVDLTLDDMKLLRAIAYDVAQKLDHDPLSITNEENQRVMVSIALSDHQVTGQEGDSEEITKSLSVQKAPIQP